MARWARSYIELHEPDFTVRQNEEVYLQRWHLVPRNDVMNIYLHRFLKDDDDRALHDHRGDNRSWILEGSYLEHLEGGVCYTRRPGDHVVRRAVTLHRVELFHSRPVISLFSIGPVVRDWGFKCPDGRWIPWQEFVKVIPGGNETGVGCG